MGLGAVIGTFLLSRLKRYLGANKLLMCATGGISASLLLLSSGIGQQASLGAAVLGGLSWILAVSCLSVAAQQALPDWVRARGLAIFQMAFFGAMTLGSVVWGQVASVEGLRLAIMAPAVLGLVLLPLTHAFSIAMGEGEDHSPSSHWPDPVPVTHISYDHGPVLVTIEYNIADSAREAFVAAVRDLGAIRRRDGAIQWGYFEDVAGHGRFIEMFTTQSWVAHLRQHERVSEADKVTQERVNALHSGSQPPRITHAVTPPRKGETLEPLPEGHHD